MDFLKNIGETVNSALDYVVEKNRKFTKSAKIKRLIKKESNAIIKSYVTLGKHYYNDLRDVPDNEMKKICESIDESKKEIAKLKEKLVQINMEENFSGYRDLVDEDFDFDKEMCDCGCMDVNSTSCCCEEKAEGKLEKLEKPEKKEPVKAKELEEKTKQSVRKTSK